MGKAFDLPNNAKCGECKSKINEGDLFTIIYEDDGSGTIKYLQCDDCEVDDRIKEYRETGVVSTNLSMEASMADYQYNESSDPNMNSLRGESRHFFLKYRRDLQQIANESKKISAMIRDFEAKHWLPYVKKYWNDTDQRGHEAKVDAIKVMMWGCAGRVMVTLQEKNESVTMIFSDEESQVKPNGGLQGIDCTQKKAQELLEKVTNADNLKFKLNKDVRMAGL